MNQKNKECEGEFSKGEGRYKTAYNNQWASTKDLGEKADNFNIKTRTNNQWVSTNKDK